MNIIYYYFELAGGGMAKSLTEAWKEGYARGLEGKEGIYGFMQGTHDDEEATKARNEGYRLGYAEYLKNKSRK